MDINVFHLNMEDAKKCLAMYENMTGPQRDKSFEFLNAFKQFISPSPSTDRIEGFLQGVAMVTSLMATNCKVPEIYCALMVQPELFFARAGEQAMAAMVIRANESPADLDSELSMLIRTIEEQIKNKPEEPPEGSI